MKLTDLDKQALRGELSPEDYEANGMSLFNKGLAKLDPLLAGRPESFKLTPKGAAVARALRALN